MITKRVVKQKKSPPQRITQIESAVPTTEEFKPVVRKVKIEEEFIWKAAYGLPPHLLRKQELSRLHGIPENDIFVDPKNGVELYRTTSGGWVGNPKYRDVK